MSSLSALIIAYVTRASLTRYLARPEDRRPRGVVLGPCDPDLTDLCVLVAEVHDEYVEALLCGDECDWATETDSVLSPILTGLPGWLLVHGDVSAPMLTHRLSRSVGQIAPDLVERIALRGRGFDFTSSDLGRGAAMLTHSDPRWEWKLEQHRQLRVVRASARELGLAIYKLGSREG